MSVAATTAGVPLVDLAAVNADLAGPILEDIAELIRTGGVHERPGRRAVRARVRRLVRHGRGRRHEQRRSPACGWRSRPRESSAATR